MITIILSTILSLEDDGAYYQAVLREAQRKRKGHIKDYPSLIIVEIDGLAYDVLCEAVDRGIMPTVKSMIDSKIHTLKKWETDLSSQTGASQAGILHGNNEDITAFRWIEKENDNQVMQCSGVTKVKILEERISDGNGLLVENGASRSNLFSGDTDNVIFTFSKITDLKKLYNGAWFSIFSNPSDFARIVVLVIGDMIHEIYSQLKHKILEFFSKSLYHMKYKVIFMVDRSKKIAGHLELDEIKDVMKEYKDSYDMYRKLLVISMVYQGETISQASDYVHTTRKTGERWVKNYNEKGLEGLYSNYHKCGRKSKLTKEQLIELKEIITSSDESYSIDDVQKIVKDKFGVNYDYKTVWTIVRKKLDLNYGKPFIKYSSRPEDAEEHLKKT